VINTCFNVLPPQKITTVSAEGFKQLLLVVYTLPYYLIVELRFLVSLNSVTSKANKTRCPSFKELFGETTSEQDILKWGEHEEKMNEIPLSSFATYIRGDVDALVKWYGRA